MQLTAKLIQVLPVQTGEGKNGPWKKGSIVVETLDDRFPRKICITYWGDKANEEDLVVGNLLDISFDIESREFNGKWYTDVRAFRLEKSNGQSQPAGIMHQQPPQTAVNHSEGAINTPPSFVESQPADDSQIDDLPF